MQQNFYINKKMSRYMIFLYIYMKSKLYSYTNICLTVYA